MQSYVQLISSLLLLGLCGVVQADGSEDIRQRFLAEQAKQIHAQGASALVSLQSGMQKGIDASFQKYYARQRVAFISQQRREVLRQGQTALASIRSELTHLEAMPIAALTNKTPTEGVWPTFASTTPRFDQ